MSRHTLCRAALAAAALAAAGCELLDPPAVGEPTQTAPEVTGPPRVRIVSAALDAERRVVLEYRLTAGEAPILASEAAPLRPAYTLAALGTDPASGLPAWRSWLLTGGQVAAALPVGGPGSTPVLADARQPGTDAGGTFEDLGDGLYRYTYGFALPEGFDARETLRVGLWLGGAAGTPDTTATLDFVPAGGPPALRQTTVDSSCNGCHGTVRAHGNFRVGVRICLTCHTYQNSDPDTVDPAALDGATATTDPNPLDLGRLVHRIHRGRNLPTLYRSSSSAPAPALPSATPLPLPFFPGRNPPVAGERYAVIGYQSRAFTFGSIESRADNGMPAKLVPSGVLFPRDLRDCDVCHAGAPQEAAVDAEISRRTCAGCHPDVWFGGGGTDLTHLAHPGGPQADDAGCVACHVTPPAGGTLLAPMADAHLPPYLHPRYNPLRAAIVSVTHMRPGQKPTVVFTVSDRVGSISPLASPPLNDDPSSPPSPVKRAVSRVAITLTGSTATDYATGNAPLIEVVPGTLAVDSGGRFTYTFNAALPATATGTWAVGLEARRTGATVHHDTATGTFRWPYTGESITESAQNPLVFIDTAGGAGPGGAAEQRRPIVEIERCNVCHGRLTFHGGLRMDTEYCAICHAPDQTDWGRRPKLPGGNVNLGTILSPTSFGTYDNVEERSVHFKVMVHRIHTGGRVGSAQLDLARPFVMYGFPGGSQGAIFFDEGVFPKDLADCTICHVGDSFAIEAMPDGAIATVANETPTIQHAGTAAHGPFEPRILPVASSCIGCHGNGNSALHMAQYTQGTVETCKPCHGAQASLSTYSVHGLPKPER
jgi:OmcA/MtrC family decaheme c-type cytochrome